MGEIPSQLFHEDEVVSSASLGHRPLYLLAFELGLYIKKVKCFKVCALLLLFTPGFKELKDEAQPQCVCIKGEALGLKGAKNISKAFFKLYIYIYR